MKDWEIIKSVREDMSDFVLHCTRARPDTAPRYRKFSAYTVLRKILQDGYFVAGFAPRTTMGGRTNNTVRGTYPAVCFTEQPLQYFIKSKAANPRYTDFAIALRKDLLFKYGGNPAIYSRDLLLYRLHSELQYLWVNYDPTAIRDPARGGYPIDWTHEREWRCRPWEIRNGQLGFSPQLGNHIVPINLPTYGDSFPIEPNYAVLVDTEDRKRQLSDWILENTSAIASRGPYWARYASSLLACRFNIFSFEEVEKSDAPLGRVEDLLDQQPDIRVYGLYQRNIVDPFLHSPVHLSGRSKFTMCSVDRSLYQHVGWISTRDSRSLVTKGIRLCKTCSFILSA
jgi:hypothetical protein